MRQRARSHHQAARPAARAFPEKFLDDEQSPYTLIVLVTGEYLDDHANQERTRIAFQSDDEPELEQTLVSRRALNQGITGALRPLLTGDLKSTNEEKRVQIEVRRAGT